VPFYKTIYETGSSPLMNRSVYDEMAGSRSESKRSELATAAWSGVTAVSTAAVLGWWLKMRPRFDCG
jgi:hypothetical protein